MKIMVEGRELVEAVAAYVIKKHNITSKAISGQAFAKRKWAFRDIADVWVELEFTESKDEGLAVVEPK